MNRQVGLEGSAASTARII